MNSKTTTIDGTFHVSGYVSGHGSVAKLIEKHSIRVSFKLQESCRYCRSLSLLKKLLSAKHIEGD
ncbi:MAG: hypothetical protein J0L82_17210 [Deltaproteobacteria bacterium]|jgi:hypothetical protein|nr:hypothetical protein [Deltaproteobacteria bacterium]